MKKVFALIAIALIACQFAMAQNMKFGKPSKEEWALTSCEEAPDAPAVVLCKTMSLTYAISSGFSSYSNEFGLDTDGASLGSSSAFTSEGSTMLYTVKMRTKILKNEGRDFANLDIIYYFNNNEMNYRDEFYSFKVTLFKNVNGKIKKMNLDKEACSDEVLTRDYKVRHVRVPQAEAGDIVEVQYEQFSNRIAYIYDWQFQDSNIPVRYSLCELNIPSFLSFNVNASIRDNIKSSVTQGSIMLKQELNNMQAPKKCATNNYRIEARNMLPWSIDPLSKVKNSAISQVISTISEVSLRGIKRPLPQPEGKQWVTIKP